MIHGESIVMRLLDKSRMDFELRKIGLPEDVYEKWSNLIRLPHGILLVTGPTGSGKTTTLYAALTEIKSEDTKIITTEDPVEYQLEGINQIQVHTKIGLTFAHSLRSILRHDPDVVLVGEIRDLETAENAVQASLTGHLVFSTLHTNDALGGISRLIDMGVEPFLLSAAVRAFLAQRLVRRLCKTCRRPIEISDAEKTQFKIPLTLPGTVHEAVGCDHCRHTGFSGRLAIYELVLLTTELQELIAHGAPASEIKALAFKEGYVLMREYGWHKVLQGDTTIEEVISVTSSDLGGGEY
jgi:general secretion pathway protein E/type IV pilus assembly protein PilB